MNIIKLIKFILKAEHPHFIYVSKKMWYKWGLIIKLSVLMNSNYKSCLIYRKKYKYMTDIVVVGLRWYGKNVKRRTSGFAKEFLKENSNVKCIYCSENLIDDNATTDHIIPISEGGSNAQINLVVTCFSCNNERGNADFYKYLKIKNPSYKGKFF